MEFLKIGSLTTREVYDFYREHREYKSKTINQYNYFVKAVEGLFYIAYQMMKQSEGGLYIEGLGYFVYLKSPRKKKKRKSFNVKRFYYKPYFFPDEVFSDWHMTETMSHLLKFPIDKQIDRKIHFDLCESIPAAKRTAKKYMAAPALKLNRNEI